MKNGVTPISGVTPSFLKNILISTGLMLAVIFIVLIIAIMCLGLNEDQGTQDKVIEDSHNNKDVSVTEELKTEEKPQVKKESEIKEVEEIKPVLLFDDLSFKYDISGGGEIVDDENIVMTPESTFSISILLNRKDTTTKDLYIVCNESLLEYTYSERYNDNGMQIVDYVVKPKSLGHGAFTIMTIEDHRSSGNDNTKRIIGVDVIESNYSENNNENEEIVYVTTYGKRYHYSKECAGPKSSGITKDEAQNRGLTPYQKCSY